MLNGKVVKISVGGEFTLVDEGVYQAEIIDVNLLENVVTSFSPEGKDMLEYKFVILGGQFSGVFMTAKMSPSMNEKSTLYKLTKAALGTVPTDKDLLSFNPELLLGEQVQLVVVQNKSKKPGDDRVFANISNYLKVSSKLPAFTGDKKLAVEVSSATKAIEMPKTDAEINDVLKGI